MLALDPPVAGFTTWMADGHGYGFKTASIGERVRGHVKRCVIVAVLKRLDAATLLDVIAEKAAIQHLTYWTEPVDDFGRMGFDISRPTTV